MILALQHYNEISLNEKGKVHSSWTPQPTFRNIHFIVLWTVSKTVRHHVFLIIVYFSLNSFFLPPEYNIIIN